MVDIKESVKVLEKVTDVDVVAVRNEVKEVNFLLQNRKKQKISVRASNLFDEFVEKDIFQPNDINQEYIELSKIDKFIYEPNNAIMKSGAFNQVAQKYNLAKLHPHTHLYTSPDFLSDFPGRRFKVIENILYSKKAVKKACPEGKANITVRNFPTSVNEIRNKTGIKDGGDKYLLAYTDLEGKLMVAVCEQLFRSA